MAVKMFSLLKILLRMRQISLFSITRLRVEECFGFIHLIVSQTGTLPIPGSGEGDIPGAVRVAEETPDILVNAVEMLKAAYQTFDDSLKDYSKVPSSARTIDAEIERGVMWRGINNYVKSMLSHPESAIQVDARKVKAIFDKYGDPTKLPQIQESAVLHNLLQDLQALSEDLKTDLNLSVWIEALETAEQIYLYASEQRSKEEMARRVGVVKQARAAAEEAYQIVVLTVNSLAVVKGEEPYAEFIDYTNNLIERQRIVLKTRATRGKDVEEDKPEDLPGEINPI